MTKVDDILESISSMTVLELSELLKEFEEKFGVTAAAPVAAAVPAPAEGGADAGADEGGGTVGEVVLADAGSEKIKIIKEVRGFLDVGLKEAKDLVESAPASLAKDVASDEAAKMKEALEALGAKVEFK